MGDVIRFKRRPRNRGQFRGQGTWKPGQKPRRARRKLPDGVKSLLTALLLISLAGLWWSLDAARADAKFTCSATQVIDGDTFDCDGQRVRMAGIDAPELPGHCRTGRECTPGDPYASTENLRHLLSFGPVECRKSDTDVYGRTVARCSAGAADLSCKQVEGGFVVRRYGFIWC